ncbi:MAG: 30S ribosomal protein S9 [Phycisphaerales bacterium]|nr:30S ribosomal protein S9 [Phycisphaerales bacterium]
MTQINADTSSDPVATNTGPDAHGWWWGTGRRKTAIARVRLKPGSGEFKVNNKNHDEFFTEDRDRNDLMSVLEKTSLKGKVDVQVSCLGGGFTGQAGAVVLGLGRAIKKYDSSLESILRENGFLTRDARKVERKKYGQAGARRRFQFSKR